MTEPWSNWPEPTIEAAPSSLVGVLLARTEQLESCRAWTVALENRLEAVKQELLKRGRHSNPHMGRGTCEVCAALDLLESPLVAE